jgi:hypothetical protein
MSDGPAIKEHMAVVGSDGQHVGTVDRLERGGIKLTRDDDPGGAGEHRTIPLGLVAAAEGGQVRLTLTGQQARALAVGGLDPREVVEDGTVPVRGDEGAAERGAGAGAGVEDDRGGPGAGGGFSGANPGGTGAGGTAGGYLGGGAGIVDDPNMDPSAARDPQG